MNDTQILPGEMLQRYIHALAEYFCICLEISSRRFLVPLLGNTNPSDNVKKYQQAFLAPLLGKALVKTIY